MVFGFGLELGSLFRGDFCRGFRVHGLGIAWGDTVVAIGVFGRHMSLLASCLLILLAPVFISLLAVWAPLDARWALTFAVIVQRLHITLEIVARVPHSVVILAALDFMSG